MHCAGPPVGYTRNTPLFMQAIPDEITAQSTYTGCSFEAAEYNKRVFVVTVRKSDNIDAGSR